MKHVILFCCVVFSLITVTAQTQNPVQFYFTGQRISDSVATLAVKAVLPDSIKIFSVKRTSPEDPFVSALNLDSNKAIRAGLAENVTEKGTLELVKQADAESNYRLFSDSVTFLYTARVANNDSIKLTGDFVWLGKKGDEYPNGTQKFSVIIPPANGVSAAASPSTTATKSPMGWTLFLICLLTGLLAVVTPCVFPLIPVTVSFFLKRGKSRSEGVRNAWWYAFSIILIYTVPTLIFTLIFGDKFIYQVSTHPVSNLLFFAIFVVFAISFFGAFELALPSSWANKSDSAAQKGGFGGIFFMALTLVIVSFSCTGPIVAGLLSETSGKGVGLGPVIGMLGFGVGLAIPFGVFALFPSMMHSLPRSGGWLNTVKVFFGFIELALAMKFLSSADLQYHWGLLNRDVFLSIWIVIFLLLGFYLLGKLKFSHDSDLPHISVTRLFVAIASFSFAAYLVPGLWGAPLKPLSGILPPPGTQAFNLDELRYMQSFSPQDADQKKVTIKHQE